MSDDLVSNRPFYNKALKALQAAHDACFKHPVRDVLGMSHGPFSGVNEALGIVAILEAENARLRAVEKAKAQEWFCDTLGEIGFVGIRDYAAMQARAAAAESELSTLRARVREVVGPFAEAAADICEQSNDDAHIWEAPCAMNITRGHLRAARQLMEDLK